jgi:predicted transposase YbfD/YdcC
MPDTTPPRTLRDFFLDLPDPRVVGRSQHELVDIVLLVLCGTIGGADDFVSIAAFAKAKEAWLRDRLRLRLPNGIPSHDTLMRVFALLEPQAFHERFLAWVAVASEQLKVKHIPIDGKTMRGSGTASQRMRHVVSAWATETGLTLAQLATEEKSNEITAIPELLDLLDVSGALVSIDALGCQKEIAQKILDGDGDYLLSVKGNQGRLYEDIERLALAAMEQDYATLSQHYQEAHAHGRDEWRFCFVLTDLMSLRDYEQWPELKTVVVVVRHRVVQGRASDETAYYISSRTGKAKLFQAAIRNHWGIENQCHWVLDVAFGEDDHRFGAGHGPENLALVRKMALAMLKKAPAKMGLKNKRLQAGWDNSFLERVLRDFLDD